MSSRTSLSVIVILAMLVGCVPSLNPVYKKENLIYDASLVGVWHQDKSPEVWQFRKHGKKKAYRLDYRDRAGNQGRFIAHLADVKGVMFLDLFPEKMSQHTAGFYQFHQVPIHTIYLVKKRGKEVVLAAIDFAWLQKHLRENPGDVKSATFQNRQLITANTEELQGFLLAHQDRFTADFKLQRKVKGSN